MAATLTPIIVKPYSAVLRFEANAGDSVQIMKSGAVAPNIDLSIFAAGPLRAYLQRLVDWAPAIFNTVGDRTRFRWVLGVSNDQFNLQGGPPATYLTTPLIVQTAPTALSITAPGGGGGTDTILNLEWTFLHSMVR